MGGGGVGNRFGVFWKSWWEGGEYHVVSRASPSAMVH